MAKKVKYQQVSVKWLDHFSVYGDSTMRDVNKNLKNPIERDSSGYLIKENDKVMAIAGTIDLDNGKETFADVFYCLKADIIDIKYG